MLLFVLSSGSFLFLNLTGEVTHSFQCTCFDQSEGVYKSQSISVVPGEWPCNENQSTLGWGYSVLLLLQIYSKYFQHFSIYLLIIAQYIDLSLNLDSVIWHVSVGFAVTSKADGMGMCDLPLLPFVMLYFRFTNYPSIINHQPGDHAWKPCKSEHHVSLPCLSGC